MKLLPGLVPKMLVAAGAGALAAWSMRRSSPPRLGESSAEPQSTAPLNEDFHARYDEARSHEKLDAPVFIVLEDSLIVRHGDERLELSFGSPEFHVLKAAAHAPIALFATLHPCAPGELPEAVVASLTALRPRLERSLLALFPTEEGQSLTPQGENAARDALSRSLAFVDRLTETRRFSRRALASFARSSRKPILQLTAEATRIQLERLDAAVESAVGTLGAEPRRKLQVVVTGNHQGRTRSLPLQYFQKRLGERDGEESRVAYAEGVSDEEGALELVGTRRLDFEIAHAFFGEKKRLQRDVLGDAATALLAKSVLRPLIAPRRIRSKRSP